MESLSSLFVFLLVSRVMSHTALPSEVYWNTNLPNIPIPKAVQRLLQPDYKGKVVKAGVHPFTIASILGYDKDGNINQVHDVGDTDFFFLEKDLYPGRKMNLYLTSNSPGVNFLSRQKADAIPFSSDKISEIMQKLSVKSQSKEAEDIKKTIKMCEEPPIEGEEMICATSLESMVDFIISKLGKHVQPISTDMEMEENKGQQYIVGFGVKKMGGEMSIICHIQTYVYPIYSCHSINSTKVLQVPLFNDIGRKVIAAAVCHGDTSKFNPKHISFQILKVKPGEVPVCHFISEGDIVWASGNIST